MAEEYIEGGYVKLSRRIFNSKTFNGLNAIQKYITIYLIMMANWKDNEWWDNYQNKFITIKRGSFITSVEQIRKEIKSRSITTKKIRVLLKKLQAMQFLAIKTASHYSLVTILKYDLYQSDENYKGKQKGKTRARRGQDEGKTRATTNNVNKDKNVKNKEKKGDIFLKAWKDFKEMRKKIKKPMTEKAEEMLLTSLDKLSKDHKEQIAILNQSTFHCWQGVFPLKDRPADSEAPQKHIMKQEPKLTPEQIKAHLAKIEGIKDKLKGKFDMPETAKGGKINDN